MRAYANAVTEEGLKWCRNWLCKAEIHSSYILRNDLKEDQSQRLKHIDESIRVDIRCYKLNRAKLMPVASAKRANCCLHEDPNQTGRNAILYCLHANEKSVLKNVQNGVWKFVSETEGEGRKKKEEHAAFPRILKALQCAHRNSRPENVTSKCWNVTDFFPLLLPLLLLDHSDTRPAAACRMCGLT